MPARDCRRRLGAVRPALRSTGRLAAVALVGGLALLASTGLGMASPEDAIMSLEQYDTAKSKALATTYRAQLAQMREHIYHCLPWVGVPKNGIGFRRPRWADTDERYLSVWIQIDQHDDGSFGALPQDRRVSAMFSRYGLELLRRMAALRGIASDPNMEGFSVILTWPKPGDGPGRPKRVTETLALFVDRTNATDFLAKRLSPTELTSRAKFFVFDGKLDLGRLPLDVWDDAFLRTFQLQGYQPPRGMDC